MSILFTGIIDLGFKWCLKLCIESKKQLEMVNLREQPCVIVSFGRSAPRRAGFGLDVSDSTLLVFGRMLEGLRIEDCLL